MLTAPLPHWLSLLVPPALAAGLVAHSASASAHGQFPTAREVQRASASSPEVVVTNYGLLYIDRERGRVELVCDELVADGPDFSAMVWSDDVVLTGYFKGIYASTDGACTFEPRSIQGQPHFVRDFARGPDGALYLVTSSGALPNGVFRSGDAGETFVPESADAGGIFLTGIHSTGGTKDLFTVGFRASSGEYVGLWRDSEGAWATEGLGTLALGDLDQPVLDDCGDEAPVCVVHGQVDPLGRFWAVEPHRAPRELWSAPNAALVGAAVMAPTRFVVATEDSTWHSADGGATWEALGVPPMLTGLSRIATDLYALGNPYLPGGVLAAHSQDEGQTWVALLDGFEDIEHLKACPAGSGMATVCEPRWPDIASLLGIGAEPGASDTPDAPANEDTNGDASEPSADDANGSAADNEAAGAAPAKGDGGCRAASSTPRGRPFALGLEALALAAAMTTCRRRRRAHRAARPWSP